MNISLCPVIMIFKFTWKEQIFEITILFSITTRQQIIYIY